VLSATQPNGFELSICEPIPLLAGDKITLSVWAGHNWQLDHLVFASTLTRFGIRYLGT